METIQKTQKNQATRAIFTKARLCSIMGISEESLQTALMRKGVFYCKQNGISLNVLESGNGLAQIEVYDGAYMQRGFIQDADL